MYLSVPIGIPGRHANALLEKTKTIGIQWEEYNPLQEDHMKRTSLLLSFAMACFFLVMVLCTAGPLCAGQTDQAKKFEEYRTAIRNAHGIDIKYFKDSMKGGRADGQQITKYDLQQLIMGITVEQEHTTNKLRALEISMDHLEEFPDYYTRLHQMEEAAEKEKGKTKADK
jgi:hypothetical protein